MNKNHELTSSRTNSQTGLFTLIMAASFMITVQVDANIKIILIIIVRYIYKTNRIDHYLN